MNNYDAFITKWGIIYKKLKFTIVIVILRTQKCSTDQPNVNIEWYVETKIYKKIRQVYIAPFVPPFNSEILLAEIVSQTLFFVIV